MKRKIVLNWVANSDLETANKLIIESTFLFEIGEPKATKEYSVQELKDMDLVGLYEVKTIP